MPDCPANESDLDNVISTPSEGVIETVRAHGGDFMVLGAAGKMGHHLCLMLRRSLAALGRDSAQRVIAVSRFGSVRSRDAFEAQGIETRVCDLSDPAAVAALPEVPNVFFLAGVKFGTASDADLLHRMNVEMPGRVAKRFASSRIVAFSTGCVYSFTPPESGGSTESDPTDPPGDYALSCLGREQAFTEVSMEHGTPVALIRLNYAIDLRYGVLVDICRKVLAGESVDVTMGYVNVIWQGDALAHAIQSLPHAASPPFKLNVTGPGVLSVRDLAGRLAEGLGREAILTGTEAPTSWLNNAGLSHRLFGAPATSLETMIDWIATWQKRGGPLLGKPTHFENRDGNY